MLSTRRSALQADVSFELVWTASRGSVQIFSAYVETCGHSATRASLTYRGTLLNGDPGSHSDAD